MTTETPMQRPQAGDPVPPKPTAIHSRPGSTAPRALEAGSPCPHRRDACVLVPLPGAGGGRRGAPWGQCRLGLPADIRHSVVVAMGHGCCGSWGSARQVLVSGRGTLSVSRRRRGVCWPAWGPAVQETWGGWPGLRASAGPEEAPARPHTPARGSPRQGLEGPGRAPGGQSQGTVPAARTTEGTVVSSEGRGLGGHVDVPESEGAAGGLLPQQQGRRGRGRLLAGLGAGLGAGA